MTIPSLSPITFRDPRPEDYPYPDVNVHVRAYWEHGPPVVVGAHAEQYRSSWSDLFEKKQPMHLEVGSGNGFYLAGMAERFPDINWMGVELRYKRVMLAAKKIEHSSLSNARILRYDAWKLQELFGEDSLSGLHTNHPDPWSRERQSKKRLLGEKFAQWAALALKSDAEWRIKTDFLPHIEAMLEVIKGHPFELLGRCDNLKEQEPPWGGDSDIITNYQKRFFDKGLPVYALWLRRR